MRFVFNTDRLCQIRRGLDPRGIRIISTTVRFFFPVASTFLADPNFVSFVDIVRTPRSVMCEVSGAEIAIFPVVIMFIVNFQLTRDVSRTREFLIYVRSHIHPEGIRYHLDTRCQPSPFAVVVLVPRIKTHLTVVYMALHPVSVDVVMWVPVVLCVYDFAVRPPIREMVAPCVGLISSYLQVFHRGPRDDVLRDFGV